MKQLGVVAGCAITSALACSAAGTEADVAGVPADSVHLTATVVQRSAAGDSVVIRFSNDGSTTAFLSRCGSQPLLLLQQFVNGEWTGGVQNFECPVPAENGPIRLAPGATIESARVLGPGRYRFITVVGRSEDLDDAVRAFSNAVDG